MSQQSAIALGKLKAAFRRLPLPDKFSRLVSLLLDHLDRDKLICWPSRRRLAKLMGCSEKTVQRNLKAIRELGLFHMRTVGAVEMRTLVSKRVRISEKHTYTIYRLNREHPLWNSEGMFEAKQVIQRATWQGIEERSRRSGTARSPVNEFERGRRRPDQGGTARSWSNKDGTDSGTFSLQNDVRTTSVACNELPAPTHRPLPLSSEIPSDEKAIPTTRKVVSVRSPVATGDRPIVADGQTGAVPVSGTEIIYVQV